MMINNYNSINGNNQINTTYNYNKNQECETCENRRYKDESDDPSVSFQSPSKISQANAAQVVRNHEQEHVINEKASAQKEGKEVVSQTVTIKTATCPECGKTYISGGETKTITKTKNDLYEKEKGQYIDVYV